MKKAYPVIITPTKKWYVVYVPELEINTQGKDLPDAIEMARDAISLWGVSEQDSGRDIPEPSTIEPKHGKQDIVTWVDVDFDKYRESYDTTAVRVNVTLPRYLKNRALEAGINFSKELQNVLKDKLAI